ncbi:hypothetical protein D3C87_2109490 [compost metagenome]
MRIEDGDRLLLCVEVRGNFPAHNVNRMLPHASLQNKIAFAGDLTLPKQNGSLAVFFDQDFSQNRVLLLIA